MGSTSTLNTASDQEMNNLQKWRYIELTILDPDKQNVSLHETTI
jgi:hypothetical protein